MPGPFDSLATLFGASPEDTGVAQTGGPAKDAFFGLGSSAPALQSYYASQEAQRKEGVARSALEKERDALADITEEYNRILSTPGIDPQSAFSALTSSRTFLDSIMDVDASRYTALIKELQSLAFRAKEPPVTVAEGGALVTPGGSELYKNTKTPTPLAAGTPTPAQSADLTARASHAAKIIEGVYTDAQTAQQERPKLEQLAEVAARNPGGVGTWIRGYLADKGFPVQGKSDLDLWSAMISQTAPKMREPGSGPLSDKDLEVLIRGLPTTLRGTDANRKIVQTLLDLNQYRIDRGNPASEYYQDKLNRTQTFEALAKVRVGGSRVTHLEKLDDAALIKRFNSSADLAERQAIQAEVRRRKGIR